VPPGAYFLRQTLRHGRTTEGTVVASPNWITQVAIRRGESDDPEESRTRRAPLIDEAAVFMRAADGKPRPPEQGTGPDDMPSDPTEKPSAPDDPGPPDKSDSTESPSAPDDPSAPEKSDPPTGEKGTPEPSSPDGTDPQPMPDSSEKGETPGSPTGEEPESSESEPGQTGQDRPDQPMQESRAIKRLRPNPLAEFELRIGNFRVLYNVEVDRNEVVLLLVGRKVGNKLIVGGVEFHGHRDDPVEPTADRPSQSAE
jgi:mRNA-degrading endonuclease RelE of RelBE toxin-antitoxin system